MRRTLFHIPPDFLGVPTLGWGWALLIWLLGGVLAVLICSRRDGWRAAVSGSGLYLLMGSLVILFLLPRLEEYVDVEGISTNLGLPVRGYGMAMFCAVGSGVYLATRRGESVGLDADTVYSLALWMFICGFIGARLFFLIQYRDQFRSESWAGFLGEAVNVAQGGLVVYGSLIGALVAYLAFIVKHRLPGLVVADILAPSMLIGLSIGRLGCFLNGCCYGGPCEHAWAIPFPQDSPPYVDQLEAGLAQGLHVVRDVDADVARVDFLDPASPAKKAGLQIDDRIRLIEAQFPHSDQKITAAGASAQAVLTSPPGSQIVAETVDGRTLRWTVGSAPAKSLPIHPTQLYSSLNAFLIFLLVLAISPFQKRDGVLLATTLTIYPLTRFLLEIVRTDEPGLGGSSFTISQWVSFLILAVGLALWVIVFRGPRERRHAVWPESAYSTN